MRTAAPDSAPSPEGRGRDSDLAQLAGTQTFLRKAAVGLAAVGAATAIVGFLRRDLHAILAGLAPLLLSPFLFRWLSRGEVSRALTATATLLLLIGIGVVTTGKGIHDVGVIVFPTATVFGSLLLHRRQAVLFVFAATFALAAIGVAEYEGILRTPLSHLVDLGDVLLQALVMTGTGWLMQVVARSMYNGLRQERLGEQTYREIFNATNDAIVIHDAYTGHVVDANEQTSVLTGYSREELIGLSLADLSGGPDSNQNVERALENLRKVREEGPQVLEWNTPIKGGEYRWMELSLRSANVLGKPRVIIAARDVTERKTVEAQQRSQERLQAIGQLAGGIAHDFNNQLTAIMSHATLLERELSGDEKHLERVRAIAQCARRSADLTSQLLAFARKRQPVTEVIDVHGLVEEVAYLLQRSAPPDVRIQTVRLTQECWVDGDASLLQNAILNLALNACDAMPRGGLLTLETRLVRASEQSPPATGAAPNPLVGVRVTDTGEGIPSDILQHIFEPFYTTKAGGTGMGLASAYGTAAGHGGTVQVESRPGEGSVFELLLPVADHAPRRRSTPAQWSVLPSLRVLLVEDNESVAKGIEALLQSLGSKVHHCVDGHAAVASFSENPYAFDLAVLDQTMPGMTGKEVAIELRAIRASIPIVATSGFGESWSQPPFSVPCVFLAKPFNFQQLREAIKSALSASAKAQPLDNSPQLR